MMKPIKLMDCMWNHLLIDINYIYNYIDMKIVPYNAKNKILS